MKKVLSTLLIALLAALLAVAGFVVAETTDGKVYEVGDGKAYATLDDAITQAMADNEEVVVYEIYGLQTISRDNYFDVAGTNATSVTFKGMDANAGIFLNNTNDNNTSHASNAGVRTNANLTFENLSISHNKPANLYKYDAGHRAGLFSFDGDITVTFSSCEFDRGVYTAVDSTVVEDCTFTSNYDVASGKGEYVLWVAGRGADSTLTVTDSEFTGCRAIKMYNEAHSAFYVCLTTDLSWLKI